MSLTGNKKKPIYTFRPRIRGMTASLLRVAELLAGSLTSQSLKIEGQTALVLLTVRQTCWECWCAARLGG